MSNFLLSAVKLDVAATVIAIALAIMLCFNFFKRVCACTFLVL